jgi:hypothetical protein
MLNHNHQVIYLNLQHTIILILRMLKIVPNCTNLIGLDLIDMFFVSMDILERVLYRVIWKMREIGKLMC